MRGYLGKKKSYYIAMVKTINSVSVTSLTPELVHVEADIIRGLPSYTIVGLGDTAVQEAKERVRSAIKNSGGVFPPYRVTVNLAPGHVRKSGPMFDLPIALSILASENAINIDVLEKTLVVGELSLDGNIRPVHGVLPIALFAKEKGYEKLLLPHANALEASLIEGIEILPAETLQQVMSFVQGDITLEKVTPLLLTDLQKNIRYDIDMSTIKGQEHAKRALEIAAAGGHNLLFNGPPGSGKTLLARTFATILPRLVMDEALEVTKIYSIAGLLPPEKPLITERPFRVIHHSASAISIVGGGKNPSPGEISLSHKGVLFMDEFPEFPRNVLEIIRQPLEDGEITVSRVQGTVTFPAQFTLIAAMNPCPCGFLTDPEKQCTCLPTQIMKYQKKVSGPILDRLDMFVEVPRLKADMLQNKQVGESSETIRERVQKARDLQTERYKNTTISCNKEIKQKDIKIFCPLSDDAEILLKQATTQLQLSGRSYFRLIRLARTIADLEGISLIQVQHIAEALQYRRKNEQTLTMM